MRWKKKKKKKKKIVQQVGNYDSNLAGNGTQGIGKSF